MNLGAGIMDLQFHYAQCYFNEGALRDIIDCGDFNKDANGAPIDESGSRFNYRCPFQDCPKHAANRADERMIRDLALKRSGQPSFSTYSQVQRTTRVNS